VPTVQPAKRLCGGDVEAAFVDDIVNELLNCFGHRVPLVDLRVSREAEAGYGAPMEDAPRDLAELLQRVGIATEQQANEIRRLLPLMEDRQRRDIWGGLADGWKVG
jgi:hypothetical protein